MDKILFSKKIDERNGDSICDVRILPFDSNFSIYSYLWKKDRQREEEDPARNRLDFFFIWSQTVPLPLPMLRNRIGNFQLGYISISKKLMCFPANFTLSHSILWMRIEKSMSINALVLMIEIESENKKRIIEKNKFWAKSHLLFAKTNIE